MLYLRRFSTCLLLAVVGQVLAQTAQDPDMFRRFEYKHSFKGPHLVDRKNRLPFWNSFGNALPSSDQVRLTPSIRSMKGHIWNNITYEAEHWEVEITLRVSGRGSVGGDGMAFWFRDHPGPEGPVFGVSDMWNGLGIILDSFDNDGGMDNPMIYMIVNDGTKLYDHNSDGRTNMVSQCKRDFRNRPHPVRLRIRYFQGEIKVEYDHGSTTDPTYELCIMSRNIKLPPSGVFGMSAATGGLADDHDVLKFLTTTLSATPFAPNIPELASEEATKAQERYDQYSETLEKQKEEYAKEHPEVAIPNVMYESPVDRSLSQILSGLQEVRDMVRNMHVTVVASASGAQRNAAPGDAAAATGAGANSEAMVSAAMSRLSQEVLTVLRRNQDETNGLLRVHGDVLRRVAQPSNPGSVPAPGDSNAVSELSNSVAAMRQDIREQQHRIQSLIDQLSVVARQTADVHSRSGPASAPQQDCLSYSTLVIVIVIEAIIAVVLLWRQKQKSAAAEKKFF